MCHHFDYFSVSDHPCHYLICRCVLHQRIGIIVQVRNFLHIEAIVVNITRSITIMLYVKLKIIYKIMRQNKNEK